MQPRAIKPGEVDYTLIHRWIDTCQDNHGDFCRLCIDQGDEENKMQHIEIMSKIYRGAWVTIVALDAQNANSGIVRTGRGATDEQAATGTSAAPVTSAQVYFERNTTQCCESIDESESSYHSLQAEDGVKMLNDCVCHSGTQNALGTGVLRDPLVASRAEAMFQREKHRMEHYCNLVECYSAKHMPFGSDALNAFQAILGQLSDGSFERGFFWSLPVEMLPHAPSVPAPR
ncbi:hypothetical protein DL766_000925 [Monosporascus sp. MC13-8B]|uniref:Heterokaryon incompatibility domain-containing protein n=1 Tax=Monosporascus cannonballus TaxID=155416 RepID=A0ABY0HB13_9PEZI|nr:hypothetical protein DL762_003311 [Monosporascus cannonballus]RYP00746.1 hypothetical protein DL763_000626 [Monosporascus cannonballus]RYP38508.1 hypothetical protein DL766_000925 [Monosporascus sp. MC13-8B]